MIPILYDTEERDFTSNGLGRLRDAISCRVTEERNGIYEMDIEVPVSGAHFDEIVPGRIIAVQHDDSGDVQPFDIVSVSKPISGVVTFHAVHVSYRLSGFTTYGSNINSIQDALDMLYFAEPFPSDFTYETNLTSTAFLASADGTPRTVRQFLGGVEGSILDAYGGEYLFDKWSVKLLGARGVVRDFAIRYGVNLLNYQDDTDYQGTFTAAIPFWSGADSKGAEVKVIGDVVESGLQSYNGRVECVPMDLSDKFENKPTKAQLRTEAITQMNRNNVNLPAQTIKVDFIRLQDSPEYSAIAPLMECRLCDTVRVIFPDYKTGGMFKIVKVVWDVLAERYESMELGTLSTSLAEALGISNKLDSSLGGSGGGGFEPTAISFSGTKSSFTSGTTLKTLSVSETLASGFWIVMASARYPSNATGYRALQITADGTGQNVSLVQVPAGGTGNVDLFTAAVVERSASWTLDLNGRQNSGSSMSVDWFVRAIKVGEA